MAKRTPANTLSSDVAGISVAQHIDQIFQVINNSRPIVSSSTQAHSAGGAGVFVLGGLDLGEDPEKLAHRPVP
jgi:hypothetical protein